MLTEHKPDKAQKKDEPQAARESAPSDSQQKGHGHHGPTSDASGAKAAGVMSHWAEAGDHKKAEGEELRPKMVHDERFSEDREVVQNGVGRILNISVSGGMTHITIGLGQKQGVAVGMEGYIKKGNGMLADFQIESIGERTAKASVDVTPDMLKDHHEVVINPTQMPKSSEPQFDVKARLLDISIVGGKTRITIGRGRAHGARGGMHGFIVGSGGKPFAKFTIDEAHSTHSTAFVERSFDEVKDHREIILNPSA
jgi:hypothetical protein